MIAEVVMRKRDFINLYKENIYVADQEFLEVLMAGYVANFIDGYAVWILAIGQSGGGKSTGVEAFYEHPSSYHIDDLTDGALASGFVGKNADDDIINKIDGKCLLISDLAGILQLPQDARSKIMAAFRRIYDGTYEREWGSMKEAVVWDGKCGLIAATVPESDGVVRKMMDLGERFVRVAFDYTDEERKLAIQRSLENSGEEAKIKRILQDAGSAFLDEYIPKAQAGVGHIKTPSWWKERMVEIADLAAILRVPAKRGQGGDLLQDPSPEIGTRLVKVMSQLSHSNALIEDRDELNERDIQLVLRIAADSIHKRRAHILSALLHGVEKMKDLEQFTGMPARTIKRELEVYEIIGVVEQDEEDYGWRILPKHISALNISGLGTKLMNLHHRKVRG